MVMDLKVGSRVKVECKSYGDSTIVYKGEIVSSDPGYKFILIGYSDQDPSAIRENSISYTNVISADNTRLHKTLSTALTDYIKLFKEGQKLKKERNALDLKLDDIYNQKIKINSVIPQQLVETGKKVGPDVLVKMIGKEVDSLGIKENLHFMYGDKTQINLTLDVTEFDSATKYLWSYREYDGSGMMSDYTQKDILNHLKVSRGAKLRGYLDLNLFEKYFKVEQEFYAMPNHHNDGTVDINLSIILVIKKTTTIDDLKDIGKLFKSMSNAFDRYQCD